MAAVGTQIVYLAVMQESVGVLVILAGWRSAVVPARSGFGVSVVVVVEVVWCCV